MCLQADDTSKTGILINKQITINGNNHIIDGSNVSRIFRITGSNVVLNDIQFINGKTSTYSTGVITASGANFELNNCTFANNAATTGTAKKDIASGVYVTGENAKITDCTFVNNTAKTKTANNGASAVFMGGNNSQITDSTFTNNIGTGSGTLNMKGSDQTAKNCTFIDNHVTGNGGGIYGISDYVDGEYTYNIYNHVIDNCTFINNTAKSTGGAIFTAVTSNGTISNCYIEKCSSSVGGAIRTGAMAIMTDVDGVKTMIHEPDKMSHDYKLINNTVVNCGQNTYDVKNTNNWHAGAICVVSYNTSFENNNFINCSNGWSGAIHMYTGNNTVDNCTFINCSSTGKTSSSVYPEARNGSYGGAISIESSDGSGNLIYTAPEFYNVIKNSVFINSNADNGYGGGIEIKQNNSVIDNCTFIGSHANDGSDIRIYGQNTTVINSRFHNRTAENTGAGIWIKGDDTYIGNCSFYNTTATTGAAIELTGNNCTVDGCTFVNNTARKDGSSVHIEGTDAVVKNSDFHNSTAGLNGGAIYINGLNAEVANCTFNNSTTVENGDAIYVKGKNATIRNATIKNSTASYGGGVFINGTDATVEDSHIVNNTAKNGGGIEISGENADVINSTIEANTAENGAGIYISGSNANIEDSTIINNNATVNGGGAYLEGSDITLKNSTFKYNNAMPDPDKLDDGLGGGAYIEGPNASVIDSDFNYNTARNGSAIYSDSIGAQVNNTIFHDNQAWSYWIPIYYNDTHFYSTLYGGDNINNAIYNAQDFSAIKVDGRNPVDGAENSEDGTILYQDSREWKQIVVVKLYNPDGELVFDGNGTTDLYGRVSIPYTLDNENVWYVVNMTHLEDTNYKAITNMSVVNIGPGLSIGNRTMYEGDITPQKISAALVDDNLNTIPKAATVNFYVVVDGEYIYLGSQNTDKFGLITFNESNLFKTLPRGQYKLFANYINEDGKYRVCNATGLLTVLPVDFNLTKTCLNDTIIV